MAKKEFTIFRWTIQILLLLMIFMFFISFSCDMEYKWFSLYALVLLYPTFLILSFCSPTYSYLNNLKRADSISEYMKTLFSTPPKIDWEAECYHYNITKERTTDSKGNTRWSETKTKVVSHTEKEAFQFYSWRDISGLFLLDSHKVIRGRNLAFIKLHLSLDVVFADDMTKMDYKHKKDSFYNRNKWRDTHIAFKETKSLDNFLEHNMIKISDIPTPNVNLAFYVLLTFIPFAEFYKLYVNKFCVEQDFQIKKLVSTRYSLNQREHFQQWENQTPGIEILNQSRVEFNNNPAPLIDQPDLPTLEELEEAKNFNVNYNSNYDETSPYLSNLLNDYSKNSYNEMASLIERKKI